MALVVVAGGVLKCNHGGQLKLSSGDDRLAVDGSGVIKAGGESGLSFKPGNPAVISPCTNLVPNTTTPAPCTTSAAVQGTSATLEVGGTAVLLDSANGLTSGEGPPGTWSVGDAGQSKLEAS
jgi:hypothetical protein